MYRVLFFVILIPPLSLYSSDLDELITYGSSTKNHLLYSRRCSALNFYFALYIPDFDQKSEEYGYFFDKIAFGFSALNYYDDREDYKNSDEIQKKKLGEKIITENDEYNEKYRDFYFNLTKDRLIENEFSDEDDWNAILPPLILSDYNFCLAFNDFLQEEIDKSPDDLSNLREQ
mgnify:CR=1 FL=1